MDKVRLVTFDIVGTVLRFNRHPVLDYVQIGQRHGLSVDFNTLERSFYAQFVRLDQDLPNFGAQAGLTGRQWWLTLVDATFRESLGHSYDRKKVSEASTQLYEHFSKPSAYRVLQDGMQAVERVKGLGKEVGVITNSDLRIHSVLQGLGISDLCTFILTSEEAGASKPQPEIFQLAVERSQLDNLVPEQILHVGDDFLKDYQGATSLGWKAVLVDRTGQGFPKGSPDPDHVVSDLAEMFDKSEL